MSVDTEKLKRAVREFEFYSRPSNATLGASATVDDVNKVIRNISQLLKTFIDELEESDN